MALSAALIRRRRRLPSALSGAAALLNTWANADGGLAFDFTDITSTQPFGSGKIIDGATPANSWSTSPTVTNFDKLTWTGASLRMCYGSDGVLRYAPHNLNTNSQTPASWSAVSSGSGTNNTTTAPDGTSTGGTCTSVGPTNFSGIRQLCTTVTGGTYTVTFWAKYKDNTWLGILYDSGGYDRYVNLQTGAKGAGSSSLTVTDAGNGWWKISQSVTASGTNHGGVWLYNATADAAFSTNSAGCYVWGLHTVATPVHSTDYIATTSSAVYKPRIDWDPSVTPATVRGLLVEEARTNSVSRSQQFSHADWTAVNLLSVTDNSATAPDGTTTAALIIPNTTGSVTHRIYNLALGSLSATAVSYSFYAKASGYSQVLLRENSTSGSSVGFTLSGSGSATAGTGAGGGTWSNIRITSIPNGWYRCEATLTFGVATNQSISIAVADGGYASGDANNYLWAGNGTSGVYLWGAQIEAGSFATSYIPTTSASVTRAADAVSLATSAFPSLGAAGTIYCRAACNAPTGSTRYALFIGTDGSNFSAIRNDSGTAAQAIIFTGGGLVASPSVTNWNAGSYQKVALRLETNNTNICSGGTLGTNDTTCAMPAYTTLRIGSDGGNVFNGVISQVMALPFAMANSDMQTLTT